MIQQTEPTTNSLRLKVNETEKVSSTICCQDRGWLRDRVGSDRLGVSVAGFAPLHQPRIVPGDIGGFQYLSCKEAPLSVSSVDA
jgi:hypothetical protein